MVVVRRAQVLVGYVRVDLRGGNIAVTEQRLYRTRVGAVLQQVSSKTVPQRVRRNVADTDAICVTFDRGPGKMARQRFAATKEKDLGMATCHRPP